MLDAIGCALAARREVFADALRERRARARRRRRRRPQRRDRPSRCGCRCATRRCSTACLTHGLDYDDTHMAGVIHLSVSVLPARARRRRAAPQQRRRDARGLHRARSRPARASRASRERPACARLPSDRRRRRLRRAWRRAALMGLSARQLVHAQGAALSMASGSLQFIEDGAWTKRFHPGWAAQAGITAATFAAHGIAAPQSPYEGRFGFYRALSRRGRARAHRPGLATAGLAADGTASVWEIDNIAVKPFPMCHFVHASADAAIALHGAGPRRVAHPLGRGAGAGRRRRRRSASRSPTSAGRRATTTPSSACRTRSRAACCAAARPEGARARGLPRAGGAGADGPHRATRRPRLDLPAPLHRRSPRHARRRQPAASTARASTAATPSGRCRTPRCARSSSTTPACISRRRRRSAICEQVLAPRPARFLDARPLAGPARAKSPSPTESRRDRRTVRLTAPAAAFGPARARRRAVRRRPVRHLVPRRPRRRGHQDREPQGRRRRRPQRRPALLRRRGQPLLPDLQPQQEEPHARPEASRRAGACSSAWWPARMRCSTTCAATCRPSSASPTRA